MDELIDRSLRGPLSSADQDRLDAWRKASPENERHYRATCALLRQARQLGERDRAAVGDPPVAAILSRALAGAAAPTATAGSGTRPWTNPGPWARMLPWGIAAAALLLLAFQPFFAPTGPPSPPSPLQVVTGPGEMTTLELDDGSVIRLAPSSRVRFSESPQRRTVDLEGKAFFSVAPDESRPFEVVTAEARATVLGTRFEVSEEQGEVRLLVVEGRVAFEGSQNRVEVGAGELSVASNQVVSTPRAIGVEDTGPDWTGRFLAFRDTPLRDAMAEVGRAYGVSTDIAAPALAQRTVTASFTGQPLGEVIEVICTIVNAVCSTDRDTIRVSQP